jgi:peptidoglycan/xylan/chitin deacetylase (PgdA/CDA1 family)
VNQKGNVSTVCLTFDFDAMSVWLGGYDRVTPAMLSRGEYGARVAVPRILELLAEYGVPATFFIPGHTVESFPKVVEAIKAAGHEIGHHSYNHHDPSTQTPDQERADMERAFRALERVLGIRPEGFRSPSWDYTAVTLPLLLEYGFFYDSSLFAQDFHPYHPRLEDHVTVDEPLRPGKEASIWEFPVCFSLDDWPHFVFNFDPLRPGNSAPSKVFEIWAGDFDYMRTRIERGVLTLTMHPQVIGRGHRMAMLERLIKHILSNDGRLVRLIDIAREWDAAEKTKGR